MYLYFALSALFNAIVSASLGVLIFLKNKKSEVNRSFAYFCIAVAFWSIFYIGWPLSKTAAGTLLWFQLLHIGACFTPATYFHFVVNWLGVYKQKKIFVYLGYFLAIFFSCFVFSSYFIADMVPKFLMRFWAEPGMLYHFYLLYFFTYVVLSSILLYRNYGKNSGIKKHQIKYVLVGIALSFIGGSTNYFLWYNINIPPYGNILASSFVVFTAYAIIRYRFMDIRIVAKRSFIYLGSAFFTFVFFTFALKNLGDLINSNNPTNSYIAAIIIAVIFTACFYLLTGLLEKTANQFIFASLYNYQETIRKVAQELTNHNDPKEIVNLIINTIQKTMRLNRAGVLLIKKFHHPALFEIAKVIGFNKKNGISMVKDNFLTAYLEKTKKPLVADELIFLAKAATKQDEKKGFDTLYNNMTHIEASLCLPLINEKKLIGIIVLGAKINGSSYTNEDLELLSTLSNQAGIAINNALLYERVKDFNKILQEKVEEQTAELEKKNADLNKLLEVKNEFLRIVNHQLNTPVSIIKNSIYMIRTGDFPLEKGLTFIEEGTKRMGEIFNDFWKAFSFEGEGVKMEFAETNIEEIASNLLDNLANMPDVKRKNLTLTIEKKDGLPKVKTDQKQIAQVISNLLENAVSYTPSGHVKVYFERPDDDHVKMLVEDSGHGIDENDQRKMFEKFTRGERAIRFRPAGSGLGLYIAKKIVEANGGEIKLEHSEVDKGSTFSLTLPVWR